MVISTSLISADINQAFSLLDKIKGQNKMSDEIQDEMITNAINSITEKLSSVLLEEFLKLPQNMQMNIVLIKTSQLLLANILCHVAISKDELEHVIADQGTEIKELTLNCAYSGFPDKFEAGRH